MPRIDFNRDWACRTKVTAFQELGGGAASDWEPVTLPHDAVISQPRRPTLEHGETTGWYPGGAFEYRKTLAVDEADRGDRFFLEFDGVYRDAMVYVNGALAGRHAYGYSRFVVRIDPFLSFGSDNEIRVECRAHQDSRWYSGAGIHRDVHLITKSPGHIAVDGVAVTTPDIDGQRAVVAAAVEVVNGNPTTTTFTLTAVLEDAHGAEVASDRAPVTVFPGERATVRPRLYVPEPALWSVDSPSLYSLRLELCDGDEVVDEERTTFGIRSLRVDPQHGLRINGEVVKLRGACIHADNGPLGAAAIGRAEERRVERLKEAGFNAIRSAHNPISSAMLEACDRLGMLVMDETFDMWTSGKSDFDPAFQFEDWWERDVEAMVAKDINHPSVVFYSIGNEIPEAGSPFGAVWGRRLAEKVRSLDGTRLVTNGINPFVGILDVVLPHMRQQREAAESGGGVNTMMADFGQMMGKIQTSQPATERTEESFAVLDVAGMNYADARYEPDRELFPNRVIVGSETWPAQIPGNWALVMAHPHVIGDFTWTGWDYLGESGIGVVRYAAGEDGRKLRGFSGGHPDLTAGTGDIDITGHRLPVSYFREVVFGLRSQPYAVVGRPENLDREIAVATPWAWTDGIASWTWEGSEGAPVAVEVYSAADEVELLLDGESVGRSAVGADKPFRADFRTTYRPGELTAVSYAGGVETGRCTLSTAGDDLVLTAVADRAELSADTRDLAFVDLVLTDGNGRVHNGRDRSVTVTVDGSGVLQALGNGNPVNPEAFTEDNHRTFDGRALAVVRPTGPGDIALNAKAEGCDPVTVTLRAR
ncbi:glycoside hydrolase family 2 TIM barrel-domain containing protein [Blastococcus sp. URHD0036]|uniref:glycoside hydrolase family 2 TIM barrel-domain containing protein n=1 Tax=Blastococcus sp. URHD0036 TaxID=1380356 RepID=UPI0004957851|nr:glycoside hydrolase family 2 TIM barrel-domain containing protein [Blastococcus sp. URHD0036]